MTLEDIVRQALSLESQIALRDDDGPGTLPAWDSLSHLRVISAIESHFKIKLDIPDVIRIRKLADIKDVLRAKHIAQF